MNSEPKSSDAALPVNGKDANPRNNIQEKLVRAIRRKRGGQLLEIGLGPKVRIARHKVINKVGISYTGLDFKNVCEMHANKLKDKNLYTELVEFIPNECGSYLYNLVRLQREGRQFDLVYLDGHHTLLTDMAAAFAVLPLLKPGALFILDDVEFTLANKESDLTRSEFYRSIYNFSDYTEDEKKEAHIGVILYEYLLPMYNFRMVKGLSSAAWVVLRVPDAGLRLRAKKASSAVSKDR